MHLGIERGRRGLRSRILNVAASTAMKVRSGVVTASRMAHIERKAIFFSRMSEGASAQAQHQGGYAGKAERHEHEFAE